jgi:hypothetical protein
MNEIVGDYCVAYIRINTKGETITPEMLLLFTFFQRYRENIRCGWYQPQLSLAV